MRIVGGKLKARRLITKKVKIRPTKDITREALFDLLSSKIKDTIFLDLYAGFGVVGIEALSRGARESVFVDRSWHCCSAIRENLKEFGISENGEVIRSNVQRGLNLLIKEEREFDLIFLDPPYNLQEREVIEVLKKSKKVLKKDGMLIFEHLSKRALPEIDSLSLKKEKKYGSSTLSLYQLCPSF